MTARLITALLAFVILAGCNDDSPRAVTESVWACDRSTETMLALANACGAGGGKYPEDCVRAAMNASCTSITGVKVHVGYNWSAVVPCPEATSSVAKAACESVKP